MNMMKLIAAIPYLAGCRNPERVAASHLSITIMAASPAGKKTGSHCFSDNTDLMERLEQISLVACLHNLLGHATWSFPWRG